MIDRVGVNQSVTVGIGTGLWRDIIMERSFMNSLSYNSHLFIPVHKYAGPQSTKLSPNPNHSFALALTTGLGWTLQETSHFLW